MVPEYAGETPEKAETVEHTYVFAGWNTTVVAVAGEVTYTATYTENARCYSVSVTDGTADVESAAYGSTITLSTEGKDGYVFMGWTVNGSAIEGNTFTLVNDAVVVAVYVESCEIALTADKTGKLFYSATESVENMLTLTAATKYSTEITWVSDNVAVATVENGVVTACGKGTAKITATAAATGETATYEVSVQNYYSISTVAEFWAIENEMDAYYALTQDIDFSGSEMRMGLGVSQAVMDSVNPDSCTAFTGVLDGNGYALKNVSVGGSSVQVLFGANKGTIKNLAVEANWTQGWDGVQGVGMLFANYGVVENVYFKGAFVTNTWNDLSFISMVCRNFSEIKNCVAVLDLTKVAGNNWNNAGMICWGYSGSKITNSYVYGNVTGATMTGSVRLVANAGSTDTVVTNSNVYTSEKEMMDAVKAGTELSDVWTVVETDATYTLKFGDEKVAEWNYAVALDGGNYSLKDGQDLTASGFDGTVTDIVYNGTSVVANCDVSTSGSIVVPAAVMSQLSAGEQVITVKTATTVYKVTLSVYTDIVTSVEEFWAIENDMAGKYLLGNDIDFSGSEMRMGLGVSQAVMDSVNPDSCTAFTGVLDGNGYALKNVSVGGSSVQVLFGANKGTIKNLAVEANWTQGWDGVQGVGMLFANYGVVENVYFKGAFVTNTWNDLSFISMVCRNFSEIKNCVAVLDLTKVAGNNWNNAGMICWGYSGSKITNSYVYGNVTGATMTGSVRLVANAGSTDTVVTNSNVYTSEKEMMDAVKAGTELSDVWTVVETDATYTLKFGDEKVAEWNYAVALDGGNYSLKDGQDLTASGFDGTVTDIVYNGTSVVANCDVSTSGSIVVPAAVMSQLSAGEQVITVKTATTVYKVTLSVYTDIVTSVEEFWAIENDMAGKYLLGNDIDFSGATTRFGLGVTQTANDNVSAESCTAFTGVLDGNGYALKNYTVDGNTVQAVFGYNKGVIKNLAVYATWKHAWDGTQCITMMMRNDGTLENVYFSGKFLTNSWNDLNYISMVARNCGELKNCVAVLDVSDVTGNTGNPAGLITYGYPAGDTYPGSKLTNSYVCVINNGTTFTGDVRLAANAGGADYCTITNSSAYTAEAELYSAIKADATYTGVWTIKDNVLYFGEIAVYTYTA